MLKSRCPVSNEEFERQKGFILNQQAQFASDMVELKDLVGRLARATLERFEAVDKRGDDFDVKIAALVDSQMRTEESIRNLADDIRNLTAVVDRYFRERNGRSEG
jgi:glutamine synthetase type III